MARFTLPRDLYHGKGALEELKHFEGKKAVVCVGGGSMKRFGFLDRAVGYLKEAGMEVELIEGIESDPSVETVMKGAQKMIEFQPDWIIAMGGGSPIDAAKAMWIKYEYPDVTFEDMCKVFGLPKLRRKAHFCAVSSTSGTATEVTAFSIITDYSKGIKYPIADFEITPDVAIVDPELAETMPKKLVAHTGMDAMTHAIEAYIGRSTTKLTRAMSEEAATRIVRSLYTAYENGGDMQARADMLRAAYCAGVSFTRSYVGYVHGVAHSLGGQYGVPHGLANAVILPYFLDAYGAACHQKLGRLARVAHVAPESASDREAAEAFIRWIREMNARMGIPEKIPQIRTADIPEMARHAARESNPLYPVPVLMDERQLAQMYVQLMPAKKEENA